MRARWGIPVICYILLFSLEAFAINSALHPDTTVLAFVSMYVFLPLLAFLLALILCATDTSLLFKLIFPVISLITIPLGYVLIESSDGPNASLGFDHLAADFSLALFVVFSPAVFGTAVGFIIWGLKRRSQRLRQSNAKVQTGRRSGTRAAGSSPSASRSGARSQSLVAHLNTAKRSQPKVKAPPLTVKLNTEQRARSGAGTTRRKTG